MEETKDVRELKSLLSGLSLQDETQQIPSRRGESAGDASAQKIALLKSVSVLFFSLSLFLILCLIFLLVRVYLTDNAYRESNQTKVTPRERHEEPAVIKPVPLIADQKIASLPVPPAAPDLPAVPQRTPGRTAVLKKEGGSLYFIALKHYGKADETLFDLILQANPAIVDVRTIDDFHQITLPDITAESYIKKISEGVYRVHVGTFDTADWAKVYSTRVKNKGKSVFIEPCKVSSRDTWYRMMMGDFENKEEALQTVASLVERGLISIPLPMR